MSSFLQNLIISVVVFGLMVVAGLSVQGQLQRDYNITPETNISSLALINESLDSSTQISETMYNGSTNSNVFVVAASAGVGAIKLAADSFKLINKLMQSLAIYWHIPPVILKAAATLLVLAIGFALFNALYLRVLR